MGVSNGMGMRVERQSAAQNINIQLKTYFIASMLISGRAGICRFIIDIAHFDANSYFIDFFVSLFSFLFVCMSVP